MFINDSRLISWLEPEMSVILHLTTGGKTHIMLLVSGAEERQLQYMVNKRNIKCKKLIWHALKF